MEEGHETVCADMEIGNCGIFEDTTWHSPGQAEKIHGKTYQNLSSLVEMKTNLHVLLLVIQCVRKIMVV